MPLSPLSAIRIPQSAGSSCLGAVSAHPYGLRFWKLCVHAARLSHKGLKYQSCVSTSRLKYRTV